MVNEARSEGEEELQRIVGGRKPKSGSAGSERRVIRRCRVHERDAMIGVAMRSMAGLS